MTRSVAATIVARRRLTATSPLTDAIEAWLVNLGAAKPSPATLLAYRRDVEGIAGRLAVLEDRGDLGDLRLPDLERSALRAAFSSWASDHAATSVRRAHSAWSNLFDFLVAEGRHGWQPHGGHTEAESPFVAAPIDPGPGRRIPSAPDRGRGGQPGPAPLARRATWPSSPPSASPGSGKPKRPASTWARWAARRAPGEWKSRERAARCDPSPIGSSLEVVLGAYLGERRDRFPKHDLDHPATPLFVDARGRRMNVDQIRYLVEKLYIRAGIRAQVPPGALVHALRHTFATSALEAGADVVELQELLGHASLETTRRYLSATAQGLRHVIEAHPGQVALRQAVSPRD